MSDITRAKRRDARLRRGPGRPAGVRNGSAETRDEILRVARRLFAEATFDSVSVRQVAAEAGVAPAMISHYFGSKDELMSACLKQSIEAAVPAMRAAQRREDARAEAIARVYFTLWEHDELGEFLRLVVTQAGHHPDAQNAMRTFLGDHVGRAMAMPDGGVPVSLAASALLGVATTRYVHRLEPLASLPLDDLISGVAKMIEPTLPGTLP